MKETQKHRQVQVCKKVVITMEVIMCLRNKASEH